MSEVFKLKESIKSQYKFSVREHNPDYIVYIDKSGNLRWSLANDLKDEQSVKVMMELEILASIPVHYLSKPHFNAWSKMIAHAISLVVVNRSESASEMVHRIRDFISIRAVEKARFWLVQASLFVSCLTFLLCFILCIHYQNNYHYLMPIMAMGFGVIGAQFSVLTRLNQIEVDPAAGRLVHWGDAATRILTGLFAALIAYVALKSQLVFGFIELNKLPTEAFYVDKTFWVVAFIAALAGFSERFVPSFLSDTEEETRKYKQIIVEKKSLDVK